MNRAPGAPQAERGLKVLVVDDEPETAAAHRDFIARVDGYWTGAVAGNGQQALALLAQARDAAEPFDLVLLDMTLPDLHGIDVARRIRGQGLTVGIIAITAVRDLEVVRSAVASGITQYLIKPFSFAAFAEKLANHRQFVASMHSSGAEATQANIDHAFSALRTSERAQQLPKGLIRQTLEQISGFLAGQRGRAYSATELASALGISRVTARRYLEHLADTGQLLKQPRHGSRGRPEYEYRSA